MLELLLLKYKDNKDLKKKTEYAKLLRLYDRLSETELGPARSI